MKDFQIFEEKSLTQKKETNIKKITSVILGKNNNNINKSRNSGEIDTRHRSRETLLNIATIVISE